MTEEKESIEQVQFGADLQAEIEQYVRRTRHLEALGRVGQVVSSSLALCDVLDRALDVTVAVMGVEAGEVWLLDPATRELRLIRRCGLGSELFGERDRFAMGEGIPGQVAETGEVVIIPDLATDPRFLRRRVVTAGFTTFAAFPLKAGGETIGVLDFATRRARTLTEDDVQLLTAIGAAVGMAVSNARLYEDLRLATKQLEARLDELQRTQGRLVATERLRAMGELAAGVAHDFNNALTVLLGQVQLMRAAIMSGTLSIEQLSECLSRQERAALDAAETVRKIREATRPQDATPVTAVDLNEVVTEVVEVARPRWQAEPQLYGIAIALRTDLAAIPPVTGRAAELREALINLVFNSVDALPQGGVITVTTRSVSDDDGRERIELVVGDTGIGMSEAVRARLFEPFFTTKGDRGTGLGLSMVHSIVSRYGGTIEVASAPGQGTVVTVHLLAASEVPAPAPPPAEACRRPDSMRVLVIDDILPIAETLVEMLHCLGYDAALVQSGEEGLARLETSRFDLVITDLGMPGMSGWNVADTVKAWWPTLPVILVTGWAEEVEEEMLAGTGVDVVLAKPFTKEQLLQALRQAWTIYSERSGQREA